MNPISTSCFVILFIGISLAFGATQKDPNGYIIFCPCMGRFGNQVDQLIGVLQFAKTLDRTLVLPNFIQYEHPNVKLIPFEHLFQLATVSKFTKVITTTEFTKNLMPQIWPAKNRTAFCWSARQSIFDKTAQPGCHPKEGSPFGPYWDHLSVDFVNDQYFGDIPGGYDLDVLGVRKSWVEKYPSENYPVLAFPSAPAGFPSKSKTWPIQKYLKWTSRITEAAKKFISNNLPGPFIGIHLRNDADWARVCEHIDVKNNRPVFASEQCLGEGHYKGSITKEICSASKTTILNQIVDHVGKIGAKSVFVASDKDHMIDEINEALKPYEIKAMRQTPDDPYTSLAILARSDLFIGNCVSTFSHIVKRERDHSSAKPKPSAYFGLISEKRKIEL